MLFTKLARFCPSIQNTGRNVLSNSFKEPNNVNVFQLMLLKRFMSSATTSTRVWTKAAEDQMNQQIKAELKAGYSYLAMSQYFSRNDVNLPNIAKFFKKSSDEEMGHAQSFIDYQNKRGGTCTFFDLPAFNIPTPFPAQCAFEEALKLEEEVYDELLKTHDSDPNDPELQDFIASEYLHEQVESINELKGYIANLKFVDTNLGTYLFDKHFQHEN